MRLSTALRVASMIIAAKAILIAVVYWRRAELLGLPTHFGTSSWIALISVAAVGLAFAAAVHITARRLSRRDSGGTYGGGPTA
jgi:hypothetical protein